MTMGAPYTQCLRISIVVVVSISVLTFRLLSGRSPEQQEDRNARETGERRKPDQDSDFPGSTIYKEV